MTKPDRTAGQPITSALTVGVNEGPGIHKGEPKIKKYLTKHHREGNTGTNVPSNVTFVAVTKTSISIPALRSHEIDLNLDYDNCFRNRENTCLCL
jgi:hypothetical protein